MRELLETLAAGEGLAGGAVLHLGAGACRELAAYQRIGAAKVLLVEALPELARALQAEVTGNTIVEVLAAAVAPLEGSAQLHVLNNPLESSLLVPTGLLERLPNLKVERRLRVRAVTLRQVLQQLAAAEGARHLMVLELQGAEAAVLRTAPARELRRFTWIAVRCSREALFEGGATLAELDGLLREAGFRLEPAGEDGAAWPYVQLLYRSDELASRLKSAESELQEQRERAGVLEADKAAAERRSAARAQADAARLQAVQAQIEALESERARLQAMERELEEARRSAALSTKLHALREADLRELQERYGAALATQERQRELLLKLAERLSAAAGYFRELTASQPILESPAESAPKPRVRGRRGSAKTP